ncbi:MAG: hypothetical protein ACYDB7_10705, partial [Mycobacteriales bacterium]
GQRTGLSSGPKRTPPECPVPNAAAAGHPVRGLARPRPESGAARGRSRLTGPDGRGPARAGAGVLLGPWAGRSCQHGGEPGERTGTEVVLGALSLNQRAEGGSRFVSPGPRPPAGQPAGVLAQWSDDRVAPRVAGTGVPK